MKTNTPIPKKLLGNIAKGAKEDIDGAAQDMRIATDALIARMKDERTSNK